MTRRCLVLTALIALMPLAFTPAARGGELGDSTTVEAWTLPNGLQVRVRDVPGAKSVAITLAYRAGSWIEAQTQPDLAAVLAQVQFTAPVGDIPERLLGEMSSVRPLGWGVRTNPHLALLTESSSADRMAGVLREVAMRARGVQVSDSCLAHAVADVRRDVGAHRFGGAESALHERVRDLALQFDEAQVLERARGSALARLTPVRVDSLLRRYYVASNASLAIVGDFSGINLHALVEREFGPVAAGTPQPDPPAEPLVGIGRVSVLKGLAAPAVAMGILAPALEDSLHPAFYLNALLMGSWWSGRQKDASSLLQSYFQYALLDEPELARFDGGVPAGAATVAAQTQMWNNAMEEYAQLAITSDVRDLLRSNVRWLLGGELSPPQRRQAMTTPTFLSTLATTTATRALWKGDAFWTTYLERFDQAHTGPTSFLEWMTAPEHQVVLVLTPRP